MITIRQVAKLAGVSVSTASYALNNRTEIKPETREKVLEAAKQLNYVPNKLARSFRNGKTQTILVVTSEHIESNNTFTAEMIGILACAREKGYDVLITMVEQKEMFTPGEIAKLLGNRMCDGYLLLGNGLDPVIEQLVEKRYFGVLLSAHTNYPFTTVNCDGYSGIYDITRLVLEKRRKNPVYFTYQLITKEEQERKRAFCDVLAEHDRYRQQTETRVFTCGYQHEHLDDHISYCIDHKVDAIVCWNDELASCVMSALSRKQVAVPDQIAVTGFDDIPLAKERGITTVKQSFKEKGYRSVELLIEQIQKEKVLCTTELLKNTIVIRKTLL